MDKLVTVQHEGNAILLSQGAADELGYKGGERLSKGQAWGAILVNSVYGIAAVKGAVK